MQFQSHDCVLVMGTRGCGKSYLAQRIQKIWPRRVIIDSLNEYSEGTVVQSFHDFAETLQKFKSVNQHDFEIVYQFDPESPMGEVEFEQIIRLCYYYGNIQLVIEEIQLYSSPHNIPHWLKNALLTGRHQNLSLLFTTQRPGELNKTILSQCSHIFCGRIVEGNDVKYISGFLRQDSNKLINMPERKFLYFSKNGIIEISNDFKI